MQVLSRVRIGTKFCLAILAGDFLAVAATLGRGQALVSPTILLLCGVAGATAYLMTKLKGLEAELTFTDWNQADLKA